MSISQSILLQSQQNWTFFILPLHIPHSYDVLKYLLTTTKQLASHTSIQFCTSMVFLLYTFSIKNIVYDQPHNLSHNILLQLQWSQEPSEQPEQI